MRVLAGRGVVDNEADLLRVRKDVEVTLSMLRAKLAVNVGESAAVVDNYGGVVEREDARVA